MMFVKMLTAMAGADHSYMPGEPVEVSDKIGKAWIKAGIAEASASIEALQTRVDQAEGLSAAQGLAANALKAEVERLTSALSTTAAEAEHALGEARARVAELEAAAEQFILQLAERDAKIAELQAVAGAPDAA